MDARLYEAAREGDMKLLTSILKGNNPPDLTVSVTPRENTALHIAVAFGHEQIVREMIDREPSLISKTNSNGDTPLHIAAKAGNLSLTKLLTPPLEEGVQWGEAAQAGAAALKKKNSGGYAPIHEALKKRHEEVALHLLRFDGDIEAAVDVIDTGESLLYLASEAGLEKSVDMMLRKDNLSTRGPNRRNPLHIAVIRGNYGVVMKLLEKRAHDLIKEADDFGRTALHYASIIGYDEYDRRAKILKLLIGAEPSLAYTPDSEGNCPLLIATMNAPFAAVETILQHCPDSAESVDPRGQNALHLAVRKKRESTLCSLLKRPEFLMQINEPDNYGDTPMHLAAEHNYEEIVDILLKYKNMDLSIRNREGFTALDSCGYETEQRSIHDKLKECGAVPGRVLWPEMVLMPPPPKSRGPVIAALIRALKPRPPPTSSFAPEIISISSNMEAVTNTLSIVTTLVATVTFAAAFTVPGGYKNDGPREGLPVFIKNAALQTFLVSDSLAFCSSMAATILLIYASANPEDKFLNACTLNTCAYIALVAIPATITAFMTGIYVLTSKESLRLAVTSILLGCAVPIFIVWRVDKMKRRADEWRREQKGWESFKKTVQKEVDNHKEPPSFEGSQAGHE